MSHSQFHSIKQFILRHAWLNLWDKHMTTGRINQVFDLLTFEVFECQTIGSVPDGLSTGVATLVRRTSLKCRAKLRHTYLSTCEIPLIATHVLIIWARHGQMRSRHKFWRGVPPILSDSQWSVSDGTGVAPHIMSCSYKYCSGTCQSTLGTWKYQ